MPRARDTDGRNTDGRSYSFPVRLAISWSNALVLAVVVGVLSGVHVKNAGFHIHGFGTLAEAAVIVWLVNLVLDLTPGPWQITGKRRRRRQRLERG
jgi:hypothetical protein